MLDRRNSDNFKSKRKPPRGTTEAAANEIKVNSIIEGTKIRNKTSVFFNLVERKRVLLQQHPFLVRLTEAEKLETICRLAVGKTLRPTTEIPRWNQKARLAPFDLSVNRFSGSSAVGKYEKKL